MEIRAWERLVTAGGLSATAREVLRRVGRLGQFGGRERECGPDGLFPDFRRVFAWKGAAAQSESFGTWVARPGEGRLISVGPSRVQ